MSHTGIPPKPARTTTAFPGSLGTLALAIALALAATPQASHAQQAPVAINLSAQPLGNALVQLANTYGLELAYSPDIVQGRSAPAIAGSLTADQVLDRLLAGSNITYHRTGSNVALWQVLQSRSAQPGMLPEVAVTASSSDARNSYTAVALGTAGMVLAPREIPQSVSVMTRQRLADQQLSNLRDVVEQAPGVTVQQSSSVANTFYSRGFAITNLKVDGGTGLYHGYQFNALPDAVQFEQVEVLRGADALFSGSGEPGGSLNLVRKRPTHERQTEVMLSAGRWSTLRGDLDVSGPLNADASLRGRAVLSYRATDSFQRGGDSDGGLLYGVLEWDATSRTLLTVGASHDRRHDPYVAFGLPRYSSGADLKLPRSTYLAGDWSHFDRNTNTVFAKAEQRLNERWSLTFNAMHTAQRDDRGGVGWASGIGSTGEGGVGTPSRYRYSADQSSADLTLQGSFELLGLSHELLAGANWQRVESTAYGMTTPTRYTIENIFAFDPSAYPDPGGYVPFFDYPNYGIRQSGFFAVARLQVTEPLKLILGARHSRHEYDYVYRELDGAALPINTTVTHYEDSGIVTPYGGVIYDLDDRWSAYASLADTYKSQADKRKGPPPGSSLEPITGRNVEVGIKGELLDQRLSVSAALYHIKRNGEAVRDNAFPVTAGDLGSNCCWLDDGRIVSKGLDLEVSGELRPGWNISAGYTFNSNSNKAANERYSTVTPRHLLKVFTSAQLPGEASAWRLGAGVNAQSATYVSGTAAVLDANGQPTGASTPYQFRESGRAVWDMFAEYRINPHWSATLNIRNVFDKTYYQTVGTAGYGNWYGEPRNVSVTLRGRF